MQPTSRLSSKTIEALQFLLAICFFSTAGLIVFSGGYLTTFILIASYLLNERLTRRWCQAVIRELRESL